MFEDLRVCNVGSTVMHGAYDDSMAEGMLPWHRIVLRQGMVAGW